MNRRDFIKVVAAGVSCAMTRRVARTGEESRERPNIILCMADDQGWGDVGYNGHPTLRTPNLDAMAASGLRFDRFYSAAPVCSPTRGSVLTGRHPNRFGCFKLGDTLRPQEVTIAEAVKRTGYITGHFGKWHLVGSVRAGSPVNPGASGFDSWFSAPNFYDNDPILSREGTALQTTGESSIVTADAAFEFMRTASACEVPFLAMVWFGSPHSPHKAAEEDRAPYKDQDKAADFLGEITGIDRAVAMLRIALRDLRISENTLFWYCSDNGGLKKETSGGRGKKGSIYEGGLRVPAIIEWPAPIEVPKSTSLPANTSDIFPTLLDLLHIEPDNRTPLDGISLVPLIDGSMTTRPRPMGFWDYPAAGKPVRSQTLMSELLESQRTGKKP